MKMKKKKSKIQLLKNCVQVPGGQGRKHFKTPPENRSEPLKCSYKINQKHLRKDSSGSHGCVYREVDSRTTVSVVSGVPQEGCLYLVSCVEESSPINRNLVGWVLLVFFKRCFVETEKDKLRSLKGN